MTKQASHTRELVIPSQTERLKDARKFIAEAAQSFGFSEQDVNKITLAVDEACTNVIKHAYGYGKNNTIHLTIETRGTVFQITITDRGKPFEPGRVPAPNMREYLTKYKRGGLGMYLMKTVMDKVEYDFKPGPVNRVRLTKYLPGANERATS
jgi:serine/threonine-protein kinase RsbW